MPHGHGLSDTLQKWFSTQDLRLGGYVVEEDEYFCWCYAVLYVRYWAGLGWERERENSVVLSCRGPGLPNLLVLLTSAT